MTGRSRSAPDEPLKLAVHVVGGLVAVVVVLLAGLTLGKHVAGSQPTGPAATAPPSTAGTPPSPSPSMAGTVPSTVPATDPSGSGIASAGAVPGPVGRPRLSPLVATTTGSRHPGDHGHGYRDG